MSIGTTGICFHASFASGGFGVAVETEIVSVGIIVWGSEATVGGNCDDSLVAGTATTRFVDGLVEQALNKIEVKSTGSRKRLIWLKLYALNWSQKG